MNSKLAEYHIRIYKAILYVIANESQIFKKKSVKDGNLAQGGGAPCIENRGIEDNFIFYIECYFFFIRVKKYKCEFNIS